MENLPVRIFAKAIGILLDKKHHEGLAVLVDDKLWLVAVKGDQITISELPKDKGIEDGCLVTSHDSEADAIVAASSSLNGKFVNL